MGLAAVAVVGVATAAMRARGGRRGSTSRWRRSEGEMDIHTGHPEDAEHIRSREGTPFQHEQSKSQ